MTDFAICVRQKQVKACLCVCVCVDTRVCIDTPSSLFMQAKLLSATCTVNLFSSPLSAPIGCVIKVLKCEQSEEWVTQSHLDSLFHFPYSVLRK